jgi:hypothetical protein
MKLTTMAKTSHVQLNIHRSKVQMVDKQSANVGTTYVVMVFSTKFGKYPQQMPSQMGRQLMDTTNIPSFTTKWIQQSS